MSDMVPISPQSLQAERNTFSPRELVYVAFRRRRWILAIWLPILIVGGVGLIKQRGSYGASSKVLLELQSPQNPSLDISNRPVDYDLAISTYTHLAMSVPVAELAAATLRDSLSVLGEIDPDFAKLTQQDKMLEFILDKLEVTRVAESNLLDIRYHSPYERVALMVNRAVRDAFVSYSLRTGRDSRAVSYFVDQVHRTESEIDSLLADRQRVSLETGVVHPLQAGVSNLNIRADLENRVFQTAAELAELETNITNLRQALAEDPDFAPSNTAATHLGSMRERVANETETYYRLLADHPEGSLTIQRQSEVLAALKNELRMSVQEHLRSQELEAKGLRAKAAKQDHQLATMENELGVMPEAYRRITMLDAQIAARTELLEGLQIKSGEVRMSGMADDRISRLTIISEPEIDTVASRARNIAIFSILSVFGLALGLLVGMVVDRGDQRIYDARVLSQAVEVPVLGSISVTKR